MRVLPQGTTFTSTLQVALTFLVCGFSSCDQKTLHQILLAWKESRKGNKMISYAIMNTIHLTAQNKPKSDETPSLMIFHKSCRKSITGNQDWYFSIWTHPSRKRKKNHASTPITSESYCDLFKLVFWCHRALEENAWRTLENNVAIKANKLFT